ncbi:MULTISPECIES: type VI immunity family protein [Acidithiobacillus]|uniref:type VI immunity family protein n=1 Tax=Acidithiobacillus ferrivorans TaxID=160808 RepID=UPI001C067ADD|nr:type VI immunity family protein [Acidithiobacillus ferrivorans]MBU2852086.1 DUF3396 domain-containing protein [Acidithiobacillus ferrivorans]
MLQDNCSLFQNEQKGTVKFILFINFGGSMSALPYVQDGVPMLDFALVANFFFSNGMSLDKRQRVSTCMEQYIELCGDNLRHSLCIVGDRRGRWSRYRPSSKESIAKKLVEHLNSTVHFDLIGGEELEVATPYSVYGYVDRTAPGNFFQFRLPWDWFAHHPGNFPDLFRQFTQTLQPDYGFGGLGFTYAEFNIKRKMERLVYLIAQAVPALVVENDYYEAEYFLDGIREGNFMTALSYQWVDKLGGADQIQSALGPEFTVLRTESGITIQAGDEPNPLGASIYKKAPPLPSDAEMAILRENLPTLPHLDAAAAYPLYHRLNQVLKPIRVTPEMYTRKLQSGEYFKRNFFDKESTQKWFSRFD